MNFFDCLRAVNSTVAKYPLNQFYFIDKKCILKCKSETIDGIMQTEISKVMFLHFLSQQRHWQDRGKPQAHRM